MRALPRSSGLFGEDMRLRMSFDLEISPGVIMTVSPLALGLIAFIAWMVL